MDSNNFNYLFNAKIIAGDGTFLGIISRNKDDTNSIFNQLGNYGNEHSSFEISELKFVPGNIILWSNPLCIQK